MSGVHHHLDISTDGGGQATFTIPPNTNQSGQSYLCFSRAGSGQAIPLRERSTTQTFFGAEDLDIAAAHNGQLQVGRIWCAKGRGIQVSFSPDGNEGTRNAGAQITFEVVSPAGTALDSQQWTPQDHSPAGDLQVKAEENGWHVLRLNSTNLPAAGVPFELTATYTATQEISE